MNKYDTYHNACISRPESYYNYDNFEPEWKYTDDYEIVSYLGKGKYSDVFLGLDCKTDNKIVVKILKPVRNSKYSREIKILQILKGGPNIISLENICKNKFTQNPSLVFEYINTTTMKSLYKKLNPNEIRYYLYRILEGLDYCHKCGIIHRDVKPINIVIDHENKNLKIIDWGLSEFYIKNKELNVRVSSKPYKSPELLIEYNYYDFSMDIWSVGCILASFIFFKDYMFLGNDNLAQLKKIVHVLGSDEFYNYLKKYNIKFHQEKLNYIGYHEKIEFTNFINDENKVFCTEDAIDLLNRMLIFDHKERLTAKEAMKHRYFDPIRNLI